MKTSPRSGLASSDLPADPTEAAAPRPDDRYRRLFETASDGILVADAATGAILDANPAAYALLGGAPVSLTGAVLGETLRFEVAEAGQAALRQLHETGSLHEKAIGIRTRDGKCRMVEFIAQESREKDRAVLQCHLRETADQDAAERLRRKRGMLETLLRSFPNGAVTVLDHDLRYRFAQGQGLVAVGLSPDALVGKRLSEVVPPEAETVIASHFRRALAGEEVAFEIDVFGSVYELRAAPLRDDHGIIESVISVSQDVTTRKETEAALLRSAHQIQATWERMTDAFVTLDPEMRFTYINTTGSLLVRKSREELIGVTVWDAFPEAVGTVFQSEFNRAMREQTDIKVEAFYPPLGKWLEVRAYPSPAGLSVYFRDITERVQRQQALEKTGERLTLALESGSLGIYHLATDAARPLEPETSHYEDISDTCKVHLGFAPDTEISYADVVSARHPEDRDRVREAFYRALNEHHDLDVEYRVVRQDGSVHWVASHGRPVYDAAGEPVGITGVTQDITRRKKAEDELRASEKQLQIITDNVPVLITRIDTEYRHRFANAAYKDFLGIPPEQIVGRTIAEVLGEKNFKATEPLIPLVLRGEPVSVEAVVDSPIIGEKHMRISLVPEFGQEGDVVGFVLAALDVTARREAENEVRELNRSLEQRIAERTLQLEAVNRELEAFSYSVSHDLRAPLRSIDGFSQVLLEDYSDKLDAAGQDSLNRVRAASQRMSSLIDDMLKLSRVTRWSLQTETVDLSAIARAVADELAQAQPDRTVEMIIAPGLEANGDPRLMKVALQNLLHNAWKYTAKHKTARIEFGRTEIDGAICFFVRDDGAGFDMNYAGKLFSAFQRLHSPREFEGTGIGLATVLRVLQKQGGRIWAEAAIEQGATFYFQV